MSADPTQHYGLARPEVQALVSTDAGRILDIGCGAGVMAAALKQRQSCDIWGVESDIALAEQSVHKLDRVITGSIEDAAVLDLLPDAHFDVIIFANVLEHLQDSEQVLRRLKRCLRDGGTIVCSVPNIRHWSVIRDLLEGRWNEAADADLLDNTHRRFFTGSSLARLFNETGYEIGEAQAVRQMNEAGIPEGLVESLASFGIDTGNLAEESQVRQFLMVSCPVSISEIVPIDADATRDATIAGPSEANPDTTDPVASLIMLTRNQLDFTRSCIESIFANTKTSFELIVVDNGSTDGTLQYLQGLVNERKPVRIVSNPVNLGFGAGNNQGMAIARGQYIALLNNDLVLTDGWLERMIGHAEGQPHIGIVGPVSNSVSGPQLLPGLNFTDYQQMQDHAAHVAQSEAGKGFILPRVVGFCMVIKRAVIDAVGGFDERFGLGNFEDDDLCWRAITAGYGCFVASDTYVHHYGSRTFVGEKINHTQCMEVAWDHFKQKWGLDPQLKLGEDFRIPQQKFNPLTHRAELPDAAIIPMAVSSETAAERAERYNSSGQRLYSLGKQEEASAFFHQAVAICDFCANALNNLGVMAVDQNEVAEAAGYLARSVENDQENADTLWNLITLYVHLGKDSEAKPLVQDYLRLSPDDEKASALLQELEAVTAMGAPTAN